MINKMIDSLIDAYLYFEKSKRKKKMKNRYHKEIIPNYIKKRRIQIYNNGKIVFDSRDVETLDIQYTIRSYGIPKDIDPNSKTPIVYNVNTTLSSMFPNKEIEAKCLKS